MLTSIVIASGRLHPGPFFQCCELCTSNRALACKLVARCVSSVQATLPTCWGFGKHISEISVVWQCPECEAACNSRQALAVHRYRKHGSHNPMVCKVLGSACCFCLTQFWTRSRLLEHLGKSSVCCENYNEQADESKTDIDAEVNSEATRVRALRARGRKASFAEWPAIRLVGPQPLLVDRKLPIARPKLSS